MNKTIRFAAALAAMPMLVGTSGTGAVERLDRTAYGQHLQTPRNICAQPSLPSDLPAAPCRPLDTGSPVTTHEDRPK